MPVHPRHGGWATAALRWLIQTKGIPTDQKKGSESLHQMLAKNSEVRGKPLQLGRTYHRRRTLRKTKTAEKATGNHPGKCVIHEIEYAATPFCGADVPSQPLTRSITPRHDMFLKMS